MPPVNYISCVDHGPITDYVMLYLVHSDGIMVIMILDLLHCLYFKDEMNFYNEENLLSNL